MYPRKRKLGRGVAMVGAGMCKFGVHKGKTLRDLFIEAFLATRTTVDKGLDVNDIEALYIGTALNEFVEGQAHTAPIMASWLGTVPRPANRLEAACASGGVALRDGILGIASGVYDVVLVAGVELMTAVSTERMTTILAYYSDTCYEASAGFTFPGLYAAMATAHMHKYGTTSEHLMKVAIKNHSNGALNPKAQFTATIRDMMNSRVAKAKEKGLPIPTWKDEMDFLKDPQANPPVALPMRLFDCSPISDGAACVVLAAEDVAKNFTDKPIYIIGTGQGSDHALHERVELTSIQAAKVAAQQAYDMAEVTAKDIQLAEVHDCFTIAEIVATEDLGFFKPGDGGRAAADGVTARNGAKPINTSGGLKSKGHPVGASGVGQAVEIWHQLRGEAGPRQVPNKNLSLGLSHNVGATGGTCTVHIYERRG